MLNKLMKYDLKYMVKNMLPFYILTIVFAILSRIFSLFNQTFIIVLIKNICIGISISMAFSVLFNTIIRSWVRFKENVYGDESYLTHTLPVSKKSIYESKFLLSVIFTLIGFIIILVSAFIIYYTNDRMDILKNYIESLSNGLDFNVWYIIIGVCVILFLEIFNMLQSGYLGIIFGHMHSNKKVVLSFVYGFAVYMVTQMIMLIFLAIYGIFNSDILKLFINNNMPSVNLLNKLIIFSTITYLSVTFIVNFVSVKMLNKGVNIE